MKPYRCKRKRNQEDACLREELHAMILKNESEYLALHKQMQEQYIRGELPSRKMRIYESMFLRIAIGFYAGEQ